MSSVGKKIFQNILALVITEVTIKCLAIFLMMAVARKLGPNMMGIYAFSQTFIWFFEVIVNFGLDGYIEREIGRNPESAQQLLARVFGLKLLLIAVSLVVILVLIPFVAQGSPKMEVVLILTLGMFFDTNIRAIFAVFRGLQKSHFEAMVSLIFRLIYTSVAILAIWKGSGLIVLVSLGTVASTLAFLVTWVVFQKRIGRIPGLASWSSIFQLARSAFTLFLSSITVAVFNSIDMVMLSLISGDKHTGYYSVAMRLIGSFDFLPGAFAGAFLPVLSRYAHTNMNEFNRIFNPYHRYLLLFGVGIAAVFTGNSTDIILLVFGESFRPADTTLFILAIAMVFIFANYPLSIALIALDKEKYLIQIFAICAAVNIALNLWLIPNFADKGAAWATVISQLLLIILQSVYLGRRFRQSVNLAVSSIGPLVTGILTYYSIRYISTFEYGLFSNLIGALFCFIFLSLATLSVRRPDLLIAKEFIKLKKEGK